MSVNVGKQIIPIFFATNDRYAPFLSVALKSLLANASGEFFYEIFVLERRLGRCERDGITDSLTSNASVEFVDMSSELERLGDRIPLRDYYSEETYCRFLIAEKFPMYKKALYLDSDIIVKGDISELYNTDIDDCLVAAVCEQVFSNWPVFNRYAEMALKIGSGRMFNAGVLLMNLEEFRKEDILGKFLKLLQEYRFKVTQDEDYLNVLCRNRVKYLDVVWNKMPFDIPDVDEDNIRIIHYVLHWKPWRYPDVKYGDYFWHYAMQTVFYDRLSAQSKQVTEEDRMSDFESFERLKQMASEWIYAEK